MAAYIQTPSFVNSNARFGGRKRIFWTLWNIVGHLDQSIDSWSRHGQLDCRRFVVKASFCLSLVRANV